MNEEHTENVYWNEEAFMIGVFSWGEGGGGLLGLSYNQMRVSKSEGHGSFGAIINWVNETISLKWV